MIHSLGNDTKYKSVRKKASGMKRRKRFEREELYKDNSLETKETLKLL